MDLKRAWYLSKPEAVGPELASMVNRVVEADADRLADYERYLKLYGGRRRDNFRRPGGIASGRGGARITASSTPTPVQAPERLLVGAGSTAPLRLNVTKAAIDTVTSKAGKARPRPTFLTNGGNWTLQRRAKQLQRFVDGAYHQSDTYEKGMDYWLDAMVLGTGVLFPYSRGGDGKSAARICVERSPAWEWFVDAADAEYGEPRCLYRVRWVSRERVRLYWPDAADTGREMPGADPDFVQLVEAWFRPLDPPTDPEVVAKPKLSDVPRIGRHVLCVEDRAVVDESYPYEDFPAVFFHWSKPAANGFWGDSAVREVEGIQVEVNRLIATIQAAMRLVGQPWVLTRSGAVLKPKELTNGIGLQIEIDGNVSDVQVVAHQPVNPQIVSHLWALYDKAFEILGSNQLAASATAPAGLESGRALERLSEQHSERFMKVARAYEDAIGNQLSRRFLRLARELDAQLRAAGAGGFKLRSPGTRMSVNIAWGDVAIDQDDYLTQVFPTSTLPTTPSARIQELERLNAAGAIDMEEFRRLLDMPDLQQSDSLATADYDNLLFQLERMLEYGEQMLPEPYQNLGRAVKLGQAAILRAMQDGAPADNIDLVRQFVDMATSMLSAAQAAAQPQAPVAPPGGGDGAPTAAMAGPPMTQAVNPTMTAGMPAPGP
jgi:hypothetical protein